MVVKFVEHTISPQEVLKLDSPLCFVCKRKIMLLPDNNFRPKQLETVSKPIWSRCENRPTRHPKQHYLDECFLTTPILYNQLKICKVLFFFFLVKKEWISIAFYRPPFPSGNRCLKVVVLVVVLFLPWPPGYILCVWFLSLPLLYVMYARRRVGKDSGWLGGLSGFFCVAGASQHYAIHSDSFSSLSPAWDWGGFVLNGDLPLATYCKKQGQRERRGNRPFLLCMKMARSRDL